MSNSNYILKAGAVIRLGEDRTIYSNPLPNDVIPELFLADNLNSINLFSSYPKDWVERSLARKNSIRGKSLINNITLRAQNQRLTDQINTYEEQIKNLKEEINKYKQSINEYRQLLANSEYLPKETESESITNLEAAIDILNNKLEILERDNNSLRIENHDLKQELTDVKNSNKILRTKLQYIEAQK